MNLRIRSYGEYSSNNYGAHSLVVDIGPLNLWFSYETIVGFSDGGGIKVCENQWGSTTGKHLNWIDGGNKKNRLKAEEFDRQLKEVLKKHDLLVE